MNRLLQQIKVSFEREQPLFAILKILRYGLYLVRSIPLRWSLNAPGLYIGPKFLLLGTKHLIIGKNFYAHSNLWIEAIPEYKDQKFTPTITIGDNVSMGDAVHISCNSDINIGDAVLLGSNIFISDHHHGIFNGTQQSCPSTAPSVRELSLSSGIKIGSNSWIGNNAVIVGGVKIGQGCIVAANSLVNKDITDNTMVAGAPARAIKTFDKSSSTWVAC
jgi:acetyltransferase-like isoleucine patch superfamily enzyme